MGKSCTLKAAPRSSWTKSGIRIVSTCLPVIDSFLFRSPCLGISAKGRKIPLFQDAIETDARKLFERLRADISMKPCSSPGVLGNKLIESNYADDSIPYGSQEFAYFTTMTWTNFLNKYRVPNPNKAEESYKSLRDVDALFRHIRNALAHGWFARVQRGKLENTRQREWYWFFQGVNTAGNISARIYVSQRCLERWSLLLDELAQ